MSPLGGYQEHRDVRLACGHLVTYRKPEPSPGDVVWCARCDAARVVADNTDPTDNEEGTHPR